ncbi:MAG: DUF945 family protein [Campylobacterota bacterium]|nr:DUF945 family protein [Campylobacterota bacterium]
MKKLSLALFALISIAVIYYVTTGSAQLTSQIKSQVDTEIASLKTQGFSVQREAVDEQQEHLVISFHDPKKIASYFTQHGAQLSVADAVPFKGLQIAVDLHYLLDAYSGLSFDIYPIALPETITTNAAAPEDKKILKQIEQMLDKKTFLLHCDVNKLGNGFKGYIKDINEVLRGDTPINIMLNQFEFSGKINKNRIQSIEQTVKYIHFNIANAFALNINGLKSHYSITGSTAYDYKTAYTIEKISMQQKEVITFIANHFEAFSDTTVEKSLAHTALKTKIDTILISKKEENLSLKTVILDMNASNLDMNALEHLSKIDPHNEKEVNKAIEQIISKGIILGIPQFSVSDIAYQGQNMEGFHLNSLLNIDKSLNLVDIEDNPLLALRALTAHLDLSLSEGLYSLIGEQPEAIMAMMLFPPKEVQGQKVYEVELKDGRLSVNGSPIM